MERFRDTLQKGGTPERKEEMCLLMTDEVLTYRGCRGSIRYSEADGCFYGRLKGTEDHLVYEGKTAGATKSAAAWARARRNFTIRMRPQRP